MEYLKKFSLISIGDNKSAGGKGASLGELSKLKINVPKGYILLSSAFEEFIKDTEIGITIDSEFDRINPKDINSINNSSKIITSSILSNEIPYKIKEEIMESFKILNSKFVAIRSSATSEDSQDAAWAGQLNTYLNTTKKNLLLNIKKCWASLFTPRAILYRFKNKMDNQKISVSIVIQEMVNSEKSGVAFSVHPVTNNKNHIIIEGCFGLGESLVSGEITPDSYVLDKEDWQIIDMKVNNKEKGLFRDSYGKNKWKKLKNGKEQVLNKKEVVKLGKLVKMIEDHYGFPVDIEWTKQGDKFYILQCRPITTLLD